MKLRLTIEVNVDEDALAEYYRSYPAFLSEFGETAVQTLMREAVTAWDSENLLGVGDPELIEAAEVLP